MIRKYQFNKLFIFVLTAAFLTLQWSSTHIHLAEHHDHDGGEHQHQVAAHQHQLSAHHADVLDGVFDADLNSDHNIESGTGSDNVVELDNDCTTCYSQHVGKVVSAAVELYITCGPEPAFCLAASPHADDPPRGYLHYHTPTLRGPPAHSLITP